MNTLPQRSPELNPVENVWQFMRDAWLSNRVFASCADILHPIVRCFPWKRTSMPQPEPIMLISAPTASTGSGPIRVLSRTTQAAAATT